MSKLDADGLSHQDKVSIAVGTRSLSLYRWLKIWFMGNCANSKGIDKWRKTK